MSFRLIDIMCDDHRTTILTTRIWPRDYRSHKPGIEPCHACNEVGARFPYEYADMQPGLDRREAAAFHEAGHVVAALAAGWAPIYLSMSPSGRAGSTAHYQVDCLDYHVGSFGHAVMALAGGSAVWRWMRQQGCRSDAYLVDAVSTGLSDVEEMFERGWSVADLAGCVRDADGLVDRHWPAIERVAAEALSRGRLDGAEIAAIAGIEVAA